MDLKYVKKVAKKEIYNYSPTKGFVELWDFSKSNLNQESREETVSVVASISYGNEMAKNPKKLWGFLIKKGHKSPFEFIRFPLKVSNKFVHYGIESSLRNIEFESYGLSKFDINVLIDFHKQTIATFKIKVPLFVRSQYHRHRCCSYLELSRRYVKPDKVEFEFWSIGNPYNIYFEVDKEQFTVDIEEFSLGDLFELCEVAYFSLLEKGYKPEVARSVLPQSLYTVFWVMKDYKCARNFYVERYSKQAQEQIREVAEAELKLLKKYQPEFLGQYVAIVGDDKLGLYKEETYIKILGIQEHYKALQSNGWNKDAKYVYVEYGDKDYYAKFNLEIGLFDEKILKEEVK